MAPKGTREIVSVFGLAAAAWALSSVLAGWGAAPTGVALASGAGVLNEPPRAVFSSNPPANAAGVVVGKTPFTVTYNMCKSTDIDEGDQLKYRYDFEGTGQFERGRCRAEHTYEDAGNFAPVVCVSDRQPDHELCARFNVAVAAGAGRSGRVFFTTTLAYADVDGDGCADYTSIPWSLAVSLGAGSTPQTWIPLADASGDGKPDSIVLDLDGDGTQDAEYEQSRSVAGGCTTATPTSTSRMVSPANPILVDSSGNGLPGGGDAPVGLTEMGSTVVLSGPWQPFGPTFTDYMNLGDGNGDGTYDSLDRRTNNGSQAVVVSGFASGGASSFDFTETSFGQVSAAGSLHIVDSDGDGIGDTLQALQQ